MARTNITRKTVHDPRKLTTAVSDLQDAMDAVDGGTAGYLTTSEDSAAAATGALSVAVCTSYVSLDGTDARTLAAPTSAGQLKRIRVVAGANTPVLVLTVTGMRVSGADVYTSGTWTGTNAPLGLDFFSSDGTQWDPPVMIGSWTIS